jgi:hypothetical protein
VKFETKRIELIMKKYNDAEQIGKFVKGRIAEEIFERMIREDKERGLSLIPFGYEKILPELSQFMDIIENKQTLETIRSSPDYILITKDKSKVFFVEVKFRKRITDKYILEDAIKCSKFWPDVWLFVASPCGLYFGLCKEIILHDGVILKLDDTIISLELQNKYLGVLKEFIRIKT